MNNLSDVLKNLHKELQLLDLPLFEKIKEEEYSPGHTKDGLKRFREKAVNERNLRESYRGRAPYELLQNADDARAKHAAYILCKEGMAFVHDGNWFTGDNFISLADGWSDKDPNECIGHKGLGFRSVLDITPSPYLVRLDTKDFFAVKFSWGINQGHIMETIKRKPEYKAEYDKWKSSGQNICPIMFIPGIAKKINLGEGALIYDRLLRGEYQHQYTTMFWFPAADDIEKRVLEELDPMPIISGSKEQDELKRYVSTDVSMLIPFLRGMESVALYEGKTRLASVCRKESGTNSDGKLGVICESGGTVTEKYFYQLKFKSPIPSEVSLSPGTPRAVKIMKEASITLSVLIHNGQPAASPASRFHVYFPTEEETGFGFIVHGDFYVTPDRKRLMDGKYNEWLLGFAAQKVAGEFLSDLLKHYAPKDVFTAMAPSGARGESAVIFKGKFSEALKKKKAPYIPHLNGVALSDEVILAPVEDPNGFLEKRFSAFLPLVATQKYFVSSAVDNLETRKFFNFAGVGELPANRISVLAENVPVEQKTASWWYELFEYMANHVAFAGISNADLRGKKLVLANNGVILAIQGDDGPVLCFPPSTATEKIDVPECLSAVLNFLDMELTKHIDEGRDSTEKWVIDRLNIAKFEANDLIPRAIRSIVEQLFDGTMPITHLQLARLWAFLKEISDIARREFTADEYWKVVGRLPLPLSFTEQNQTIPPSMMVPAFLIYWPEGFSNIHICLEGVQGVRRVSQDFLEIIGTVSGQPLSNWRDFFQKVGVSNLPKRLKYSKGATEEAIPLTKNGLASLSRIAFCGERQKDENLAVVNVLKTDGLWNDYFQTLSICNQHSEAPKNLQHLTVLENFIPCCRHAIEEYENCDGGDDNWQKRLISLINGLEMSNDFLTDKGYCGAAAQKGSHDFDLAAYMNLQMGITPWLPTSLGPRASSECLARFTETRLVSKGKSEAELGDLIIPYVVVSDYSEMVKLKSFGIKDLFNVDSVDAETLVRALRIIGEKLDSEWGKKEILAEKGRWRLVRGAIQEIYRRLNQVEESFDLPDRLKIAAKTASGVSFIDDEMYYAKPGSATEQAFLGVLPLIDVDRPLKDLFEKLSVRQLIAGDTVSEELDNLDSCKPARQIHDVIVNELARYLLAVNYDRGEKEVDRFIRRLNERFDVFTSEALSVSVTLVSDTSLGGVIRFRNFYLAKKVVPLSGAAEEYHFSLIVEGQDNITFDTLDADALGEILTQVFMDRVTDEALGYFPRITSRFQQCRIKGDLSPMQDYLHLQLGIPVENQDSVNGLLSGEYAPAPAAVIPPPPKAKVIVPEAKRPGESATTMEDIKQKHHSGTTSKLSDMIAQILSGGTSNGGTNNTGSSPRNSHSISDSKVTREQQVRGLKGEDELKRRLMTDGGWEGFTLLRDTRQEKCGFDFLCLKNTAEVKVELKTFTENGYISVTNKELFESGKSKD